MELSSMSIVCKWVIYGVYIAKFVLRNFVAATEVILYNVKPKKYNIS